ncbi:lipid-A-disaccharide synthase N-terminal domain-containing protein [Verrucomicrobium spinosum]|uniref:lipid-A-disaccharide synthase N-terminal domain-containing protein n=1 Tax=Verrucomicrobium spinosum TaxID=2736 RepID=UPI0009462243|nr:lipid-A-disaccharide synthase N-terminal domain-containing protein [Verrucomicrobium spinosum]
MSDGFLQPYLDSTFGHWLYIDSAMWTAVGFLGAAIFGSRFVLQWLQSEKEKKLVVPWYFWHLSFWGSVLNLLYFLHIDKAPLILGNCFLPFLYGRNIIFLRQTQDRRRGGGRMVMAGVVVLMLATFGYTALTSPDAKLRQDLQASRTWSPSSRGLKDTTPSTTSFPRVPPLKWYVNSSRTIPGTSPTSMYPRTASTRRGPGLILGGSPTGSLSQATRSSFALPARMGSSTMVWMTNGMTSLCRVR